MQMTSPEDELAIRDIEKQLLNSIENLPTSHQYHRTAEPHSPGYGIAGMNIAAGEHFPHLKGSKPGSTIMLFTLRVFSPMSLRF